MGERYAGAFLKEVIDAIPDPVYVKDRKHRRVLVNDAFRRMAGNPGNQGGGCCDWSSDLFRERDEAVFRSGEGGTGEAEVVAVDGSLRTVQTAASPFVSPEGEPCLVAVVRDITRLRENEIRLNEAQKMAKIGSWEVEFPGLRFICSDEFRRIFRFDGRKGEGSAYDHYLNAIHPEDRQRLDRVFADSLRDKTPYFIEHRLLMEDGSVKYVQERGMTHYDGRGNPLRTLGTVQDITEQVAARGLKERLDNVTREKELQEQMLLEQSKLAETGGMISMIAHQWRQPLAHLLAAIGTLKTKVDLEVYLNSSDPYGALRRDLEEALGKIEGTAEHLSRTVDDFRNFYRPDKAVRRFSVLAALEAVFRMMMLEKKGIDCRIYGGEEKIGVETFEGEFKQVVINILNNALDVFAERETPNPRVGVSIREEEGDLLLSIVDNGGGIPQGIMEKIFLPYVSTKSKKNGTGIGLYMSRMIVERHMGGTLEVSNDPLFGGAEFTVRIPLTPNKEQE